MPTWMHRKDYGNSLPKPKDIARLGMDQNSADIMFGKPNSLHGYYPEME